MPLNPNGKVDKPALPFPDTAQFAAASRLLRKGMSNKNDALTATQRIVRDIWLSVLPHPPSDLGISDNFFDIGGHSILATRVVFEIRKRLAVDISLGILFRQPTIGGISHEIDTLQGGELDISSRPSSRNVDTTSSDYFMDAMDIIKSLPDKFPALDNIASQHGDSTTIFLTGATGFLGAFLIREFFLRQNSNIRIIAHVRAKSTAIGLQRIRNNCEAYGTWSEKWASRLEVVTGSLEDPFLGIDLQRWEELAKTVDIVIHNGAMVHFDVSLVTHHSGPLGIPICAITRPQRGCNVNCALSLQNWET